MNDERDQLRIAIDHRLSTIYDKYGSYIIECKLDTVGGIDPIKQYGWHVTFKMSKEYEYTNDLLNDFAYLLHVKYYRVSVRKGFLTLRYIINEKGAREIEKEDNQPKD